MLPDHLFKFAGKTYKPNLGEDRRSFGVRITGYPERCTKCADAEVKKTNRESRGSYGRQK